MMPENKSEQNIATQSPAKEIYKTFVQTRTIDDVFTDGVDMVKPKFVADYRVYLEKLWEANPDLHQCLQNAESLEKAREAVFDYLEKTERQVFEVDNDLHILEKSTVRESIRVFKSIIGPINEKRCGVSALKCLWELARDPKGETKHDVSVGFLLEFINLFRGVAGNSNIYFESRQARKGIPDFLKLEGREAARVRTERLDEVGATINKYFKKYPSGLDQDVISWRNENRKRLLNYFGGTEKDWQSYTWQIRHVIRDTGPLVHLIELSKEQKEAIDKTGSSRIPFGITPYYLSLMDRHQDIGYDHAIRAQVLPPPDYVSMMAAHGSERDVIFDFMGEHDTSPIDLVTRRYPGIAILKPFNTCAQICVYCQRNWEIDEVLAPKAMADKKTIDEALAWFDEHPAIGDILITGGDPCIMSDATMERILSKIAEKKHVYRIRIGTRTPVVLPMRWTDSFVKTISQFHEPGRREIAIVTHFEHPYEITPEAMAAVQKIKKKCISVYNQQVFTIENSRRFESAKLRKDLRLIGVDPYYTFNMKGKEETRRYMVPIARILQERKEEARMLPGLDRTDEPVFNVPKLGKNHLRAWQDHRLV
ncbi:MAG: KamA family radical SAM protein, partial [Deltaproteobacteria bacterium]|nr:KamA family radical SAM protein [Deltaproteobacteria bacterium]